MEEPLGRAVGNSIEIIESIEFLKGKIETGDVADLTYSFAAIALNQLGLYETQADAKEYLISLVENGKALEKFKELIAAQGGNPEIAENYDLFTLPTYKVECKSKKNGYVHNIDAYKIAYACKILGAGRDKKTDPIDYSVGIFLNKKSGEEVHNGDILYTIYSNSEEKTKIAQKYCDEAFSINEIKPSHNNMIYKIIKADEDEDV
jgi:pyrimidine-nucleoside phosphorylase